MPYTGLRLSNRAIQTCDGIQTQRFRGLVRKRNWDVLTDKGEEDILRRANTQEFRVSLLLSLCSQDGIGEYHCLASDSLITASSQ